MEPDGLVSFDANAASGAKDAAMGAPNGPIADVSWNNAARFVNWLANGQGNGDTESGIYDMSQAMPPRAASAAYFLPILDE